MLESSVAIHLLNNRLVLQDVETGTEVPTKLRRPSLEQTRACTMQIFIPLANEARHKILARDNCNVSSV